MSNSSIKALDLLKNEANKKNLDNLLRIEFKDFEKLSKSFVLIMIMKIFLLILYNQDHIEKESNINEETKIEKVELNEVKEDKIKSYKICNEEVFNKFSNLILDNLSNLNTFFTNNIKKSLSKHLSQEIQYEIYKVVSNYESSFVTTIVNKISSSFGIIVFPLREILEYYGIVIDKKTVVKNAEKLNSYVQEKIDDFEKKQII